MKIPNSVIDPFSNTDEIEMELEEELIELQINEELKLKKSLLAFSSSYLVERGFSVVTDFLTNKRSRLQIAKRGDLRLFLTNIEPNGGV
ncbi:hypothetical protein T12_2619 [Trichinella patagoniensis]|uniref:SCAN domain-containing protein 3 n=1 Tax=Trichinella patagoniensis TaxID=990121 RepID=A0A0V0ZB16_9BILA|nr:hypothetical protein T12_2619 [Trichinella patagoniensis]